MIIKQLSVFVENRTGRAGEVARILAECGVNMTAFSLAETPEFGILRLVVSDVEKAANTLKHSGFGVSINEVVCLSVDNAPGALASILQKLAGKGVFIEYMYAFSEGDKANVVIRPTGDVGRAAELLK